MPGDRLGAVTPYGERRARGVAVRTELLSSVLVFGLFDLDNDVGNRRAVGVHDDNIGALRGVSTERDGIFDGEARQWIFVEDMQPLQPKLAHQFLRLCNDFLVSHETSNVVFAVAYEKRLFNSGNCLLAEQLVERRVGDGGDEVGDLHACPSFCLVCRKS